jgi:outer membrane protein assembly factor BamA
MKMWKRFRVFALLAVVALIALRLRAQTSSSAKIYTLSKVVFTGSKRFSSAQLLSASGLHIGQKLSLQGIDDASARLFATGALSKIGYGFGIRGDAIEVNFDLADVSRFLPCNYDNFVWFSDAQLNSEVQKEVLLFDGSMPEGGNMAEKVSSALDHILAAHKISGSTMVTTEGAIGQHVTAYRAVVTGIKIPVVAVNVAGGPLGPDALVLGERMLMNANYSRASARAAAAGSLAEAYQDEAYLQVKFTEPVTTMKDPQGVDESQGVSIAYTLAPGPHYSWNGVEWSGDQVISGAELTNFVGMKNGDPARRNKMNEGWHAVKDAFGHLGYLIARVNPQPQFDPDHSQVHFVVSIVEGPQYFMGEFHVRGVEDKIATAIQKGWKLQSGQPFDSLYEKTFYAKDFGAAWFAATGQNRVPETFDLRITPNHQTHVVAVELQFH